MKAEFVFELHEAEDAIRNIYLVISRRQLCDDMGLDKTVATLAFTILMTLKEGTPSLPPILARSPSNIAKKAKKLQLSAINQCLLSLRR